MKQLLFILDWYPTMTNHGCIFVKHLICAIADQGYECVVIAPRAITKSNLLDVNNKVDYSREEYTEKGNKIRIYMPFFLHLSSRKQTMKISMNNHYKSVLKVIKKEKLKPDLVYGHFLYQCGLTASRVGQKLGIPSYCACGENSLRLQKGQKPYDTGLKYCNWNEITNNLNGIICVSSNNKELLVKNGFLTKDIKLSVFPNGVNGSVFHQMDQDTCREELGLPKDKFIVAFTGAFTSAKGADNLNEALKECEDVYSLFLGKGPVVIDCPNNLFNGRVDNSKVATYLNAADVFVLPTKGEGCSNAIVEALACGLPVISSDLPFNDDILNETNSLRVDVEDVNEIREAIMKLKNDPSLCQLLADGAKCTGEKLDITKRAQGILSFMEV